MPGPRIHWPDQSGSLDWSCAETAITPTRRAAATVAARIQAILAISILRVGADSGFNDEISGAWFIT
jgi:hypothetical protein